jgi:hypothetical protein
MTYAAPDPVPSGQPLPVIAINGRVPHVLDDFVGEAVFTLQWGGSDRLIAGQGSNDGAVVRFHEKDSGHGKDVRVWLVRPAETGQFTACTA